MNRGIGGNMTRLFAVLASAALIFAGAAQSSTGAWAGLTKPQAILKAKNAAIGLCIAFGKCNTAQAVALRHKLDRLPATTRQVRCKNGRAAWFVRFGTAAQSDPLYVNAKGLQLTCR